MPRKTILFLLATLLFLQSGVSLRAEPEPGLEPVEEAPQPAPVEPFQSFESEHFVLKAKGRDLILVEGALSALEKAHKNLGEAFGWFPSTKTLVEIYRTKEEFAEASTLGMETLERSGAVGICKFEKLMILTPEALALGYRWQDALSHEYTHHIVNHLSDGKCPLWLHEGTAKYHETLWRVSPPEPLTPGETTRLAAARDSGSLITFERMHPSMVFLKNQEEVSLAFSEVTHAVGYLTATYGSEKFRTLLKTFADKPVDKSFKKVLGKDMTVFEQEWRAYLSSAPLSAAPGALAGERYLQKGLDEVEKFVGADLRGNIRLGDDFRKSRNFDAALIQYEKALAIEPLNPVILSKIAKALTGLDKLDRAEKALQLAVEKNPDYVSSYVQLADLFYDQGLYKKALPLYEGSLALNPFNPHVHKRLGRIHCDLAELKKGVKDLEISAFLQPEDLEIRGMLLDAQRQLKRSTHQ